MNSKAGWKKCPGYNGKSCAQMIQAKSGMCRECLSLKFKDKAKKEKHDPKEVKDLKRNYNFKEPDLKENRCLLCGSKTTLKYCFNCKELKPYFNSNNFENI